MSKHRVRLTAKQPPSKVDEDKKRALLDGEVSLMEGLGVTPAMARDLRRQALALFQTRRWQQCVDVLAGLAALGQVHPADAIMLAECARELGKPDQARALHLHADLLCEELGLPPPPWAPTVASATTSSDPTSGAQR